MSGINLLVRLGISAVFIFTALSQTGSNANAAHSGASFSICTSPIKVMPLGDSITTGKYSGYLTDESNPEDDIGYRKDLWDLLTGAGYDADFVGSVENGAAAPINFNDPQHEGHNGETDSFIAANIYNNNDGENWLSQNPPDVILLHIGTNTPRDPSNLEIILDEIDEFEVDTGQKVIVFVARIIDLVANNSPIHQYNVDVATIVQARLDFGIDLFLVDMEDGAGMIYDFFTNNPPGDMLEDGIHPYVTGYTKMANTWMTAISDYCAQQPKNIYLPIAIR